MSVVRAALVQTNWTGDKESMIVAHEEYARQAAAQGAKVMCFQELFGLGAPVRPSTLATIPEAMYRLPRTA